MDVYRLGCWYSYTPDIEIEKREKLLGKVMEYKKSLIYEVVTGKKEV